MAYSYFTEANARLASRLIYVLEEASQPVEPELKKIAAEASRKRMFREQGEVCCRPYHKIMA